MSIVQQALMAALREKLPFTMAAVKQLQALRYGSLYGVSPARWAPDTAEALCERIQALTEFGSVFYYDADSGMAYDSVDYDEDSESGFTVREYSLHDTLFPQS